MKAALLMLLVIGVPYLLSVGIPSAEDIHCWLQHFGIL